MASPLRGEGLGELYHASLRRVVARLLLRVVDDSTRHGSNVDDRAAGLRLDHLLPNSLGDEEGSGDVDVNQTTELVVVVCLSLYVGASKMSVSCKHPRGLK
jgi:hypothetical protein